MVQMTWLGSSLLLSSLKSSLLTSVMYLVAPKHSVEPKQPLAELSSWLELESQGFSGFWGGFSEEGS
jgi:hypothetical protein